MFSAQISHWRERERALGESASDTSVEGLHVPGTGAAMVGIPDLARRSTVAREMERRWLVGKKPRTRVESPARARQIRAEVLAILCVA